MEVGVKSTKPKLAPDCRRPWSHAVCTEKKTPSILSLAHTRLPYHCYRPSSSQYLFPSPDAVSWKSFCLTMCAPTHNSTIYRGLVTFDCLLRFTTQRQLRSLPAKRSASAQSVLPNDLQPHTRTAGWSVITSLSTAYICWILPKLVRIVPAYGIGTVLAMKFAFMFARSLDHVCKVVI